MRFRVAVTVAFALIAGAIAAAVLVDARTARLQALLASIEEAEHRVPFAGVREIEGGGNTVVVRVWSAGDGRRRVEPVSGRPGLRGGLPNALRPRIRPRVQDFGLAVRNYEIVEAGRTVVAGRPADLVEARPRHDGRPLFRVAADVETRLPLRFEVIRGGAVLFRAEFTSVDLSPSFEGVRFPAAQPSAPWLSVEPRPVDPERLSEAAGFPAWTPAWLPRGFERRGASVVDIRVKLPPEMRKALPMPDLESRAVHLEYTDGLAVLAVVEVSTATPLWRFVKRFLQPTAGAGVVAHRVAGPGGSAYVVDLGETAVLVAGNAAPAELESVVRTLVRK